MRKREWMMIIAAAAGAAATGSYPEAAGIVLLYLGCKMLEKKLVSDSRERIAGAAPLQSRSGWTYEEAVSSVTRAERNANRFAAFFGPVMAAAAVATAVIPSVVTGNWVYWVRVGCTFLIAGCVGTVVVSVPLAFRCGIAVSSARGIFFKSGRAMETISNMKLVAMAKTGILTDGQYGLQRVLPAIAFEEEESSEGRQKESEEELILRLCAGAAAESRCPVAPAVLRAADAWKLCPDRPKEILESTEDGVRARFTEGLVCFGTREFLQKNGIRIPEPVRTYGLQILLALDGEHIGTLILADRMRDGAESLVQAAKHVGARTAILTEESAWNAEAVAKQLHMDLIRADLSDGKKTETMKDLRRKVGGTLYFGTGIRDVAVMEAADVSGTWEEGTEEAAEAADILYAGTALKPMENSIDLAFVTTRIAGENVFLSVLVKAGIVFLGFVGYANLWLAIVADIGIAVICIVNAVRVLYFGKYRLPGR